MASEDLYVFPAWLEQVVEGNVNVLTDTLEMVLCRSHPITAFDPDAPPSTMAGVESSVIVSDPVVLDEKVVANGRLFAGDVYWSTVDMSTAKVTSGLIYWNTGPNPTDKLLVSLHRKRADTIFIWKRFPGALTFDPDGPKLWRWSPDGVLSI